MSRPLEDRRYAIEEWTRDNARPVEINARVSDLAVAMSAFAARPKVRIVLRHKERELARRARLQDGP